MHTSTIYVNPTMPDNIGFAQAMGMPGDVRFYFKGPSGVPYSEIADLNPQLVMRSFTGGGIFGYDIDIHDVSGASGIATIPASVMNDRFNIEVYTRNDLLQPQDMIACGRVDLTGYGYAAYGPLAPASYSIGPAGPAGPQGVSGTPGAMGAPGMRGSRWYTGVGAPALAPIGAIPDDRIEGDMYLDETNGNVWRWDSTSAGWLAFKGV